VLIVLGITISLAAPAAGGTLPAMVNTGLLGPDGVHEAVLADYPDLRVVMIPADGRIELRRPDGRVLGDDDLEADQVRTWGSGSDTRLVRADSAGRIVRVSWGSGRQLQVMRGTDGEVIEVVGSGGQQRRVSYAGGLSIQQPLGVQLAITGGDDGRWTVRDGTGRQTRMFVDPETLRLTGWEDPRGLSTRIRTDGDVTELVGPAGDVWRTKSNGVHGWVELPDGQRWGWTQAPTGAVTELLTPAGTRATWVRDPKGRVLEAEHGGRRTVLERDSDGHLLSWIDPAGSTIRLRWEGEKAIRVTDAGGAAVAIERDEAGRVEALQTRSGGRWELERGLDGALDRVTDPAGRTLVVRRDGGGRVVTVNYQDAVTELHRDSAGRVTLVRAANGATTGFVRDAGGRIRSIRQAGRTIRIDRDSAGDVAAVHDGALEVLVERDPGGRALSAGPMQWVRDLVGQVRRVVAPAVDLRLERDILGRVRELIAGLSSVQVTRTPDGHPVRWRGAGVEVRMTRDASGRPVSERVGEQVIRLERDTRGHPERADSLRGTWRWSRGADAGMLRLEGPDGAGVGIDRDEAGRLVLGRLPGGGLSHREFRDGEVEERLDDAGGGALARGVWRAAPQAGVKWAQADDGLESTWVWDDKGDFVGVDVAGMPEESWVFGFPIDRGPTGWARASDALDRTTELSTGDRWPAWGALGGAWAYHRDQLGRLHQVTGEDGAYVLGHDPFGRLLSVDGGKARWEVEWDAMGRPHKVRRPGQIDEILWAPGQTSGTPLATGRNAATAWLDSEVGLRAWSRASSGSVSSTAAGVVDLPGIRRTFLEDPLGVIAVQRTPTGGIADSGALHPLGASGGISLFIGGPELMTGVALEPAALERTDGTLRWPWVPRGRRPSVLRAVWDPSAWAPEVDWGDPLELARQLGAVDIPERHGTLPGDFAVPWLPASLDSRVCPVGPAPGHIGIEDELEPLVWRIVNHLATEEGPLGWDVVAGPLIDPAQVGRLPPGLRVPGLHDLDAPPDVLQAPSLEQKVLAGWSGLL